MAYDQQLAERIRDGFAQRAGITEKRMFGGLVFSAQGNIIVGIWNDALIVRLGAEADEALRLPGVRPFDVTGRPMRGWVLVDATVISQDRELQHWLDRAFEFVQTLPAKP